MVAKIIENPEENLKSRSSRQRVASKCGHAGNSVNTISKHTFTKKQQTEKNKKNKKKSKKSMEKQGSKQEGPPGPILDDF